MSTEDVRAALEVKLCIWCRQSIAYSTVTKTWHATGYIDLGGYCPTSPNDEHEPAAPELAGEM